MRLVIPWSRLVVPLLAGAALGYAVLHPYSMFVYALHRGHEADGSGADLSAIVREVVRSFSPEMLHMGIPYALLGAAAGLFFGFWKDAERRRGETEKQALAVDALVSAIDAKSPWTKGHSENVAKYAVRIAARMGLGPAEISDLRLAALLHDIGKIGTYDPILEKHGELDEEEYAAVKRHPDTGADILKPLEQLRDVMPAVRHHHESWDGSGYPDGLKGEEIPLLARIISVADAYEAMTAERPYKPPMTDEYAMGELEGHKGIKFAPEVVDAFLELLKEKKVPSPEKKEGW